jgi:hypothetical protein
VHWDPASPGFLFGSVVLELDDGNPKSQLARNVELSCLSSRLRSVPCIDHRVVTAIFCVNM